MSWTKHFRTVANPFAQIESKKGGGMHGTSAKYSSVLPEIFAGNPNRIQRYYQFDDMARDSDVAAALDTIADFCTQSEEQSDTPFEIDYCGKVDESAVKLLDEALIRWVRKNKFKRILWRIFRDTLKYGDSFFAEDPETNEWYAIDNYSVELVKVSSDGFKKPQEYVIKNFDPNVSERFGTAVNDLSKYHTPGAGTNRSIPTGGGSSASGFQVMGLDNQNKATQTEQYCAIDAEKMVHLSLNELMDQNWPFGCSILEPVFKTFKQKEMLEDSILIYRVQRAPERRIFYIDVGEMPPAMAKMHLEAVKNDIHQRRIPNKTGGGSVLDTAYNPLCLDLETRVPLLDGRTLTITQLISEHQAGKENWAYSCDPITGEVLPGVITWAGITRKSAKTIKLTFDNGKTLTCTPDHKIPVLGKGFVEAKDLTVEDSLISFETKREGLSSSSDRSYEKIYDHASNDWVFTHHMVGDFFRSMDNHQEMTFLPENVNKTKAIIHHKDFNHYNNDPRNLTFMNKEDHLAYHVHHKKEYWENIQPEERARISNKISHSLKKYYSSLTEQERVAISIAASNRNKQIISEMKKNNPERFRDWRMACGKSRARFLQENPDALKTFLASCSTTISDHYQNVSFTPSQKMMSIVIDGIKTVGGKRKDVISWVNSCTNYGDEINRVCGGLSGNNKIGKKLSDRQLNTIISHFNYKNWNDLVEKSTVYNHRVVSIEQVEDRDVGTITIDFAERWNKHHTFAIEAGIFVKNSMMDDYFFAQPMEGRGSRVETLPGGDALGEIGDLTYFTKKMARGLRIPTSYLALGDDEQPAMYNDGKLGQTMIQEFKFTKYCMRLQNLLAPEFDKSFKRFLEKSGISIDDDLFELRFFPPQNFTKYRQLELDLQQTQVYGAVSQEKLLSKRFKLERYLGLSEAEIIRNQELWAEENARKFKQATGASPAESSEQADLSAVGFSGGGGGFGGGFDDMVDVPGGDDGMDMGDAPDLSGGDMGGDAPPPEPMGGDKA